MKLVNLWDYETQGIVLSKHCAWKRAIGAWASDIGPDHTPDEAGLGWALKMKSNISFKGRSAVAEQRQNGVKKIMATFTTEPTVILSGRETIYRNGERCGWLSSAGYGYTIQKSIGMGYVRK